MEFNGRIVSAIENANGEWVVSIATHSVSGIEKLLNANLDVTIKKHRKPRSTDANAYFHVLLSSLADELTVQGAAVSKEDLKCRIICDYGQPLVDIRDGKQVWMEITCDRPYIMINDNYAVRRGSHTEERDGELVMVHSYQLFRPSHTYDSREFTILLNGLISECKDQGIDTRTPNEIEQMMALWKEAHG